jgi:hypothetical protein
VVHSFASVWRALLGCACAIGLAGIGHGAAPEQIDFSKHVQPILAEHCAHCHGIDESTRQGGLRLDIRQNALEGGDSGEPAILPGKPEESELVARIRAVGRRTTPNETAVGTVERSFGPLSIDTRTQRVSLNGTDIHLTPTEFELLVYLTEDPGAVCRRSDILNDVWDTNWFGTTKTLDAHVAAIRKKLGSAGWIESVRGVGFRFGQPT